MLGSWKLRTLTVCVAVLAVGVWTAGTCVVVAWGASPSGRAFELVSPHDKNGGNIGTHSTRTRAADSGDAVQFESLAAFGGVVGTGVGTEYIARRDGTDGTQGWSSHPITPLQEPLSFAELAIGQLEPRYQGEFSADLSTGVFLAHSPLFAGAPNVEGINTLYLRENLLTPGGATSTLLTDCLSPPDGPCASPLPGTFMDQPGFAGASADFGHVIFESRYNLTNDASGTDPKLYEWDHGSIRLAGVLPLPDGSAAASSAAGRGAGAGNFTKGYSDRTISTDGSRILFTSPVNPDSSGASDADLYLRENHATTTQINAELPDGQATFWAASADLSRILFTQGALYMWSDQALTETQTLTVSADSGTFTLELDGDVTAPLAFDAPAATVQAALNGLSTIGGAGGSVTVTGGPGDATGSSPYAITFSGTLANQNVAFFNSDLTNLGAAVGKTLTCSVGPASAATRNVQWLRDGTPIPGATSATYTTVGADAGSVIQCQGSAINANAGATQVANPGIVVTPLPGTIPPVAPARIDPPVVTGVLDVGSDPGGLVNLTCDPGSWAGAPSFGYQWYRNGVALSGNGASSSEYTVQAADLAAAAIFQCAVTGTNAGGAAIKVSDNLETTPGPNPQAPTATATTSRLASLVETQSGGHLTIISADSEPDDEGATIGGAIGASEDGDYVYFTASGQLVDDNIPNTVAHPCESAEPCIFAWHQGTLRYVARINALGEEQNVIIGNGTWTFENLQKAARITPDGTRLVFVSEGTSSDPYDHGTGCANSAAGPKPGCKEVYLYDATASGGDGQLTCVSCNPGGVHTTATDADFNYRLGGAELTTSHLNRAISDDGRYVFFSTGEPLVLGDTNGSVSDVYQYDTQTGQVELISTGTSESDAYFLDASASGHDVFFTTRETLNGWDTDKQIDLYDARINGGFDDPEPAVAGCKGEACLGPASPGVGLLSPGTASFETDGAGGGKGGRTAVFHAFDLGPKKLARWAKKGAVRLVVSVSDGGRISARVRGRIGERSRIVAKAARTLASGNTVTLRLKLTPAARQQLARTGRLKLTIVARYSRADGVQRAHATLIAP